jgi:16S rRNA (uracil1498-N3)-methyltransferase
MGHPGMVQGEACMTLPRFLVEPHLLVGARAVISGAELRHLRVRRLRPGSALILSDAHGHQRRGFVVRVDRHRAVIDLTDEELPGRESPLRLVLAQAVLKADRMNAIVEKATELGVSEIVLFTCERSLGRPSSERLLRWNRIARSATKQSQRSNVPVLKGPIPWADLLQLPANCLGLLFWEGAKETTSTGRRPLEHPAEILAVVGPEGGFTQGEGEQAESAGFVPLALGPRILRAETAAIAAVTLCQFLWGDLAKGTPLPELAAESSPP